MKHFIDATGEEWLRQFDAIREAFLEKLRAAAERYRVQRFHACDRNGKKIDRIWLRLTPSGMAADGTVEQAEELVSVAFDDGFSVAFGVTTQPNQGVPEMWLTQWEIPQEDPVWPSEISFQLLERHDGVFRVENHEGSNGGA